MKKLRSISYYVRREKLRSHLAKEMSRRRVDETALEPANENTIIAVVDQASFVDAGTPAALSSTRPAVGFG